MVSTFVDNQKGTRSHRGLRKERKELAKKGDPSKGFIKVFRAEPPTARETKRVPAGRRVLEK